jgi:TPR repeat protein
VIFDLKTIKNLIMQIFKLKTLATYIFFILLSLNLQFSYACISNEYNRAYSLFKHSDYTESTKAFIELYKKGCPTSPYFLGISYTYGIGSKQDFDIAIKYFDTFLDKSNKKQPRNYRANAYLALAYIYKSKKELNKANEYLIESAELDNSEAIFFLGRSYINEKQPYHIKTDSKKAFYWLNKAANYGNVEAMKLIYQYDLYSKSKK